jgi:hypothetical protein
MLILKPIVALFETMLVCGLYGAGLRRQFGSLPKIPDVPRQLWHLKRWVLITDWIFTSFILTMMTCLFMQMGWRTFLIFSFLFYIMAEALSYKIRLLPSFYISVALALLAIALVLPLDWIIAPTVSATMTEPQ